MPNGACSISGGRARHASELWDGLRAEWTASHPVRWPASQEASPSEARACAGPAPACLLNRGVTTGHGACGRMLRLWTWPSGRPGRLGASGHARQQSSGTRWKRQAVRCGASTCRLLARVAGSARPHTQDLGHHRPRPPRVRFSLPHSLQQSPHTQTHNSEMKAVHVGKTERKIIDLPIPSPEADEVLIKGEQLVPPSGLARPLCRNPATPARPLRRAPPCAQGHQLTFLLRCLCS